MGIPDIFSSFFDPESLFTVSKPGCLYDVLKTVMKCAYIHMCVVHVCLNV